MTRTHTETMLLEALEWSHAAFVAQRDQAPVRKRLMALTIKNCRMAVVDIIAQSRRAIATAKGEVG